MKNIYQRKKYLGFLYFFHLILLWLLLNNAGQTHNEAIKDIPRWIHLYEVPHLPIHFIRQISSLGRYFVLNLLSIGNEIIDASFFYKIRLEVRKISGNFFTKSRFLNIMYMGDMGENNNNTNINFIFTFCCCHKNWLV